MPTGSVTWVDLATPDLGRSTDFYDRLFGWAYDEYAEPGLGTYVVARVPAGSVGGMMRAEDGRPPAWSVLVSVPDLDGSLARTEGIGGRVLQRPIALPDGSRLAVVADPAGGVLALVQPAGEGMRIVRDEPGALCWVECLSRDPAAALRFYETLLDWKGEEGSGGYVVLHRDGELVGGLMAMPEQVPAAVPSYWLVYFAVTDVEAACARTAELGGSVLAPPRDIDEGRFAVLADPLGAVFAVFAPSSSS